MRKMTALLGLLLISTTVFASPKSTTVNVSGETAIKLYNAIGGTDVQDVGIVETASVGNVKCGGDYLDKVVKYPFCSVAISNDESVVFFGRSSADLSDSLLLAGVLATQKDGKHPILQVKSINCERMKSAIENNVDHAEELVDSATCSIKL